MASSYSSSAGAAGAAMGWTRRSDITSHRFDPFEVSPAHLIYVGLGFFIVIFGMLSLFIKERLYLGEAVIAAVFGIIVGPVALNLFNPADWGGDTSRPPGGHITNEITLEVMRVTIALSVFAVGVELPKKYLLRHWRSIAMLLGPVMIWGWMVTAGLIYGIIPGLDFLNSMVVAACVTPTDPILAQAVVGGPWAEKHVPAHLRHMLMCESGCNDGAAFPFLYLALYLTTNRDDRRFAIAKWFYDTWAYEIILGTFLGALIGFVVRKFMRFSERKKLVDRESFVAQYVSLAVASMGVNVLLGSDDLLAAFACGTAFAWDGWFTKQTEDSNFSNIVDLLFNCATFIYIGALMPFHAFADDASTLSVWRLFVLAICVLLLKRIPIIILLWKWIPDIKTFREAIFSGHFGPMGVGAIFIATLGRSMLPDEVPNPPETSNDILALAIQPIVFFFVLCSIAVHGLTIPFFAFSRRAHTITTTWSRHPSFAANEPSWMTRVRRINTGDEVEINRDEVDSAEKGIADELQLGIIGRGAIGGDAEKELRREDTFATAGPSGSGSASGSTSSLGEGYDSPRALLGAQTERDLELGQAGEGAGAGAGEAGGSAEEAREGDGHRVKRLEKAGSVEDPEDYATSDVDDPSSEWCGQDTVEMRRYRAKRAERKAAKEVEARKRKQMAEGRAKGEGGEEEMDLGEAPMDRELLAGRIGEDEQDEDVRKDKEGQAKGAGAAQEEHGDSKKKQKKDKEKEEAEEEEAENTYPRTRQWIEGNTLVLECQKSASDDPSVQVISLSDEEQARLAEMESPAYAWVREHKEELEKHVGDKSHESWDVKESVGHLMRLGIPRMWESAKGKQGEKKAGKEREEEEREEKEEKEASGSQTDTRAAGEAERAKKTRQESGEDREMRARLLYASSHDPTTPRELSPAPSRSGNGASGNAPPPVFEDGSSEEGSASPPSTPPACGSFSGHPEEEQGQEVEPGSETEMSRSSSRSPPLRQQQAKASRVYVTRPAGSARRPSMRRKLLAGQLSLGGRRGCAGAGASASGSAGRVEGVERQEEEEVETTKDAEEASAPAGAAAPAEPLAVPGADSGNATGGAGPGPGAQQGRGHHRTPSVQWLDVADSSHDHGSRSTSPSRHGGSTRATRTRTRTLSNASVRSVGAGESAGAGVGAGAAPESSTQPTGATTGSGSGTGSATPTRERESRRGRLSALFTSRTAPSLSVPPTISTQGPASPGDRPAGSGAEPGAQQEVDNQPQQQPSRPFSFTDSLFRSSHAGRPDTTSLEGASGNGSGNGSDNGSGNNSGIGRVMFDLPTDNGPPVFAGRKEGDGTMSSER